MLYLHDIDPIAFSLGPIKVHWYGIMYLLGFAAAWWLGRVRIRAGRLPGVDMNGFSDLLFYATADFLHNPLILLRVWEGGMSFHGGLLGVMAAGWWWTRKHALHYFDTIDFVAPLVPLGLGFGRLGNFVGGELWGKFTHAGWGVVFPHAPLKDVPAGLPTMEQLLSAAQIRQDYAAGLLTQYARHPSQLYEALLEGLVMFVVLWAYSMKPRPRYAVSGLFALMYGSFRFLVEFVRMPDNGVYLAFDWFTRGQLLSLPLIVLGLVLLAMSRRAPTLQPALPAGGKA